MKSKLNSFTCESEAETPHCDHAEHLFFSPPLRGFSLKVFIFKDQVQAQPYVIYLSKKSKRDRLGREIMKDFL